MKKGTIIAVLVFVGLLVAVILTTGGKTERGITRISFASVDTESIDRMTITGKNPIEIKREEERWVLGDGVEADKNAVKRLLEAIPKIESSDLVTQDSSRFAEQEVDEEKGTRVAVFSGEKVKAEFVVGKSASGGSYVRIDDSVYLVKKVYPYVFSKKASAWHKLKLFDTKLDEVARVELTPASGKPYVLVKREDKWSLEDPKVIPEDFRFDHSAARSLVSTVVNARAKEIVLEDPGVEKTGLEKGFDILAMVDKDGKRHEVHLGASTDKEDVYAKVEGSKDLCLFNKHTAGNMRKQALDLRDLKMIDLDVEKVTKLSIVDGKKVLKFEKQGAEWKIGKSSEKIPEDFELDSQMVTIRLRSLSGVRANKLAGITSKAKAGLARPKTTVMAALEDGSVVTLAFGKQTKDDNRDVVYAMGNIDKEIYLVNKGRLSSLTNGISSFKKRPPPQGGMPAGLDPKALSRLPPDMRAGLMQRMQQEKQKQEMMKRIQERKKAKEKKASK